MNPLLSQTKHNLKMADAKIANLEQQIESAASQGREEMSKMRHQMLQLQQEKEVLNRTGKELEMAWTREKERISMLNREKEDLSHSSTISATKIADLQAQVENSRSLLAVLQQEQYQRQTADDAAAATAAANAAKETEIDPVLNEALESLQTAKAAALEKMEGLESRIRLDEDDICVLRGQLEALRRAKDDAEARVQHLEIALEAELKSHEASMLRVHDDCHQKVQERVARYEEEIIEMRAQVANIREAKMTADRCVSDLETMLDRARLDGEAGQTKIAELEARIAELEATAQLAQLTNANVNMLNNMAASTPVKHMDAPSTPLTGSDASTAVLTPAGTAAPPTTARKALDPALDPASPDMDLDSVTTPRKASWTATPPNVTPTKKTAHAMVSKMGCLGSEIDQLTEMQLETVISSLEGQIVSLEGELARDRAAASAITGQLGDVEALRADYDSRISDLENRLQIASLDNVNLHKFLCEVTEAMEKTAHGWEKNSAVQTTVRRETDAESVALI
jgi:chromosome segregation ATPase